MAAASTANIPTIKLQRQQRKGGEDEKRKEPSKSQREAEAMNATLRQIEKLAADVDAEHQDAYNASPERRRPVTAPAWVRDT